MFCTNCGKQIPDGSIFCTGCGTRLGNAKAAENTVPAPAPAPAPAPEQPVFTAPAPAPAQPVFTAPAPEQPVFTAPAQPVQAAAPADKSPKNAPKLGLIIGIAAAVVVIAALVVMLVTGVFAGAKGKVEKAVVKSVKAYSSAADALGGPNVKDIIKDKKFSESLSFAIKEIDGDDELEGLGVRFDFNFNADGRHIDAALVPFYESADIAEAQLLIDDSKLYAGSPELTDGKYYGLDTATLGSDMAELIGSYEFEDFGFNIFDIIDSAEKISKDSINSKALDSAGKALVKAISVKKAGSETISVNDGSVKAAKYDVVIPQKALEAYVDSAVKCINFEKYSDGIVDMLSDMGIPEDYIDDITDAFDDLDTDDLADDIKDEFLDELGDIELEVYISGGYISSVIYEKKFYGDKYIIELNLGGGENYVDDFSLSFATKYSSWTDEYIFVSSGNHSGKGGVFTDSSKLTNKWDGNKDVLFSAETEYTKKSGDFSFRLVIDEDDELKASGTLKMDSKSIDLDLTDFKIKEYGDTVFSGELGFRLMPYSKGNISVGAAKMLADMDEDDFADIAETISDNFEDIIDDLGFGRSSSAPASALPLPTAPSDYPSYSSSYTDGLDAGYDAGYEVGYQDGWDEVDWGENYDSDPAVYGYYGADDDFEEGFAEGYYYGYDDAYWDGYPGYSRYTSYGDSAYWW